MLERLQHSITEESSSESDMDTSPAVSRESQADKKKRWRKRERKREREREGEYERKGEYSENQSIGKGLQKKYKSLLCLTSCIIFSVGFQS